MIGFFYIVLWPIKWFGGSAPIIDLSKTTTDGDLKTTTSGDLKTRTLI